MKNASKLDRMNKLRDEIISLGICSELASGAKNLVMGEGSLDAKIMFIGEAPGKKEDESGRPFVGASGKVLDSMLSSVGINREEVYITSVLKYRPPENRDPTREEKEAFGPYLRKQIEIIDPDVIVTLGRHSLEFFNSSLKISSVHGEAIDLKTLSRKRLLIPMYHPAVALYRSSQKQKIFDDFKILEKHT